ncbi:guanitoxin biosynthesis L-enduracididine beta-hydroxylase GntD [Kitasatospora sp. NPDC001309]|uniref:guanitoxin biosynthesis L-enduracididine beta-hydroxylase GntD n=1 Tax=Kitasatospora sp. NPDC001309 TaxID=3364013 RepID=UPI0036953145
MFDLSLTDSEREETSSLITDLINRYPSAEDPELLERAPVLARALPTRVQEHLNRLRRHEPGFTVIHGHHVDDVQVGPTPGHWNALPAPSPTLALDLTLVLYAGLLGDAFGWATQQDGRVIHDVLPIKENEGQQLGTAADVLLDWHTEDAFHPLRPDWLALACVRNPTFTATTVAVVDDLRLSAADRRILSEPRFLILPDNSHLPSNNSADAGGDFEGIEAMFAAPPAVALLEGGYLRADRSFWGVLDPADTEAQAALERLTREIDRRLRNVVLEPGDILIVDNFRAVHGRVPFEARYDGTDRWLKRVLVTRDLRKSRAARPSLLTQVVG